MTTAFALSTAVGTALAFRLLRVAVLLGLAFAGATRTRFGQRFRVLALRFAPGQLRSEARAGVAVLAFDTVLGALLWWALGGVDGLRGLFTGHGVAAALWTFAALFAWYELWFYATHRLLHTRWAWRWHRQHHTAVVCSPLTAFSFSLVERAVLFAGIALFVAAGARWAAISAAGVLAYAAVNQVLNVIGHTNVEPAPRGAASQAVAQWLVTPTFHALHHARRRSHYGLFTTVLDRLCGTVERDYAQALAATSAGRPLLSTHRVECVADGPTG